MAPHCSSKTPKSWMGLQTLVHFRPGWRMAERGLDAEGRDQAVICGPATLQPPQQEDFHLPSPAQHTEHSNALRPQGCTGPGSGTTLTATLSILHSFPPSQFSNSYSNTQAHSSTGSLLPPLPGLHSARPSSIQALTLFSHHSKFTSVEWHFLSSLPGTQYPKDISILRRIKWKTLTIPQI